MGGRGTGATVAAPSGAAKPAKAARRSPAQKAADDFGVPNDATFQTLHRHDAFRAELDDMRIQKNLVEKGVLKESETRWGKHGLTPTEYAAMQVYSGGDYRRINAHLRGEKTSYSDSVNRRLNERAAAYETTVNRALAKLPTEPGVAYRGFQKTGTDHLLSARPGDTLTDRGFTSSSASAGVARNFGPNTLVIQHKTGRDFSRVVGGAEKEVLFKTGAKFRVISNTANSDGGRTLYVEEI